MRGVVRIEDAGGGERRAWKGESVVRRRWVWVDRPRFAEVWICVRRCGRSGARRVEREAERDWCGEREREAEGEVRGV